MLHMQIASLVVVLLTLSQTDVSSMLNLLTAESLNKRVSMKTCSKQANQMLFPLFCFTV